jgi:HAD superfamily hydrolase (TIGR01458 family)
VLYVYPHALPGSVAAVERLTQAGFPHLFLTNSSLHPKSWILGSLREAGFDVASEHVLTAVEAAGDHLLARGYRRVGWLCAPSLIEDVPGVEAISPGGGHPGPVDVILVGDLGSGFTYEVLNQAFRWLHDGAALVAVARNRYYQTAEGLVLDSGPFVRLLEYAGETEAWVAGKPSSEFFRAALHRLGFPPEDTVMVGDDLEADVLPAMELGIHGVLVRTGKFREHRYEAGDLRPDRLVANLAEAVEWVLRHDGA